MNEEEKFLLVRKKIRNLYIEEKKEHLSKKIVLITNNTVFPSKNQVVSKMVDSFEKFFIKDILKEDFVKYKKSLKISDMTTIKEISQKHSVDLARLNGYTKYICNTEDEYIKNVIDKIFSYYQGPLSNLASNLNF